MSSSAKYAACAVALAFAVPSRADELPTVIPAQAEVIATGVRGAGAIAQVHTFHLGGPFHDNGTLAQSTLPGAILDKQRLFVASSSNYGAALARADQAPGSVLSIDPRGGPVAVPADFAIAGGQVTIAGGRVALYAANSPAFLNSIFSPGAATANEVSTSNPTGISFNNAFGRPWFSNAPAGNAGDGTICVIDPDGAPFKGSPDPVAGGVFSGGATNSGSASQGGLFYGALGTALLTKSPDGTGRAVFVAANGDGSLSQVHVQKGVDLLAPPGTFTPIATVSTAAAESTDAATLNRVGIAFNWVPTRIAYVADPLANRIVALDLAVDGRLFTVADVRSFSSAAFDLPVDLAPTSVETAARNFASNTTLGGGSDLYVLNRGNNSIARMTQDGTVTAIRSLDGVIAGLRVAGLATSDDGRSIWVTATLPGGDGLVLRTDAFGGGDVTASLLASSTGDDSASMGADVFSHSFTLDERVGPLFNGVGCASCHNTPAPGGMGSDPDTFVVREARVNHGVQFDVQGGPVARAHSVAELGSDCGLPTGVAAEANVTSLRSAMTLRGTSLVDNILDAAIFANMNAEPADVRGRPNLLDDGRIGRFGWKAHVSTLVEFMGEAMRDEIGVTNAISPRDNVSGCQANVPSPEADGVPLTALVAFLDTIDPPVPSAACLTSAGAAVFASVGCAGCHTPSLPGPGSPTAAQKPVRLYSDLLLHDMGSGLADGLVQAQATGSEFRTAPLWRVSDRAHFLHDGRAATIPDAISAHGGQGASAAAAFSTLSATDRQALLDFLGCI